MTVQQSPALCEEFLPYDETGFQVCYMPLPCSRKHAGSRQVADKFDEWAKKRAYATVWLHLEEGVTTEQIKNICAQILGLNWTKEEGDAHVAMIMNKENE